MEKLKSLRKRIDELDKTIMDALEERLNIARAIGKVKFNSDLDKTNTQREQEILMLTVQYNNGQYLKNIYKEIFKNSKKAQDYNYFLVGKNLDYSFSPLIYTMLGISDYNLYPTNNFLEIENSKFKGINITNPFKLQAYNICDELSKSALTTGVVNTIVRIEQKLIGHNTDLYGFSKLLDYNDVDVTNKKIIIIGNGATANTIRVELITRAAKTIINLVRNVKSEQDYLLSSYNDFSDYEVIINATPYGTYPSNQDELLFPIDQFENLETLIDVIYNPSNTPLLQVQKDGVKRINGLLMLVAQAAEAASLYTNQDKLSLIEDIYKRLNFQLTNIVLIGMPFSGKSTLAKQLSKTLKKQVIDLDSIMEAEGNDLGSVLKKCNLEDFRKLEEEYAVKFSKERGKIISTGGGIIYSKKAMQRLKQNGVIVFIDVLVSTLIDRMDNSRPLVKNKEDIRSLYNERIQLYNKYSDITITNSDDIDGLEAKLNEYINN